MTREISQQTERDCILKQYFVQNLENRHHSTIDASVGRNLGPLFPTEGGRNGSI